MIYDISDILKIVQFVSAKCNPNFVSANEFLGNYWNCKAFSDSPYGCTSLGDYKPTWNKVWHDETFWDLKNEFGETPLVCPQCGCAGNKARS